MVRISVSDMARATSADVAYAPEGARIEGVTTDSREVCDGCAFVCFKGERVDGNRFAPAAIEAGAAAVVMTEPAGEDVVALAREHGCAVLRAEADDAEEFMLRLAGAWRRMNPQWIVVGVTGSVGKTTTKDMLRAGLARRYRVHATAGNFNNLIGLPITVLGADAEDEVLVCEMGMNHKGELTRLAAAALPTVSVITNVGTSHIGLLGSRENIARAKAEIVSGMEPSDAPDAPARPCLALTSDNDFAPLIEGEYARPAGVECLHVGQGEKDDVRALDVTVGEDGCPSFYLAFADGWSRKVSLNVPGRAVVSDFLLAMAICDRLGVDRGEAAEAMSSMPRTGMRLEVVSEAGKPRMIDDSYNASPSSIAAALDVLCTMACTGRRVAVLGEVGELGAESRRLHGYIGAYAAAKPIDLLVLVGTDDAREMREAALTMGFSEDRIELFEDVDAAVKTMAPVLREDDLVLAKGSRSVGLDKFVKGVLA